MKFDIPKPIPELDSDECLREALRLIELLGNSYTPGYEGLKLIQSAIHSIALTAMRRAYPDMRTSCDP